MRSGWQPGTHAADPVGADCCWRRCQRQIAHQALHRGRWGFSGWVQHDEDIWQEVKKRKRKLVPVKAWAEYSSHFYGSDSDARVIQRARTNARLAGDW
ncbi:hypothetical protein [Escherichia coli]|uniref:hypothetical protein n=1 Tax=Escherichia coli TaxID=562 RepID=UPI003CC9F2C1